MKPYWPNGFVSYFTSIKTSNVKSLIWNVLNNSFCNSVYLTVLFRLPRKLKPRNLTARNWKASKEKHRIKLIHPVYKLTFDLLTLSVQFSRSGMSNSLRPHESQHARPPCPSPTPGVHSDSRPSSQWCHPVISSSVVPISFCPRSLPASESFPMSQHFAWGGQSTEVSASASSFQRSPRADLLQNGLVGSSCSPTDSNDSSTTLQYKSINSSALSLLCSPNLTSIHDHWKNHSLN